jgi:hypothetical protein
VWADFGCKSDMGELMRVPWLLAEEGVMALKALVKL